ncbi:LysR substrate-binding domain-containing protein [Brevibacterium linens]|uniref:LysR substrate-binding domain-containing protein n=1 Tax=Brevibacterium linens TaxID=1703 RepID=UPI003BF533B5
MVDFSLRQLEYFVAAIDAGSVTGGARSAKVTQATVSMAIFQLEKLLKTELLVRNRSKGVVPTRAGQELTTHARRLLAIATELEEAMAAEADEISGTLEVGCVSSLSPEVIPPLTAHFERTHPAVTFNYHEGSASELQDALTKGALDIAIVFSRQAIADVESIHIAEVVLKIMLPSTHRLRKRRKISFSDVAHESAILIDLPPSQERSIEFMRAAGVEPRIRLSSANLATVTALVADGHGYSLRYSRPDSSTPPGPGIIEIPVADSIPENGICAVTAKGRRLPRRVDEASRVLTLLYS